MERTGGGLTISVGRRLILVTFLPMMNIAPSSGAIAGEDFLVIEKIGGLRVLNRYQQEANPEERQELIPYLPLKIVTANDLLGDGFTPCMKVEANGRTYYIIKDKNGALIRSEPLGFERTYSNATSIFDTVLVLRNRAIRLVPPNDNPAGYLSAGTPLVRLFRHRGVTYCRILNQRQTFGWIDFRKQKEGYTWRVQRTISSTGITPAIAQKIQSKLDEVNTVLANLFGHFSPQSSQRMEIPLWEAEFSDSAVICSLRGRSADEDFHESTFYLAKDLQNIVLGANLQVSHVPGRIEIKQHTQ